MATYTVIPCNDHRFDIDFTPVFSSGENSCDLESRVTLWRQTDAIIESRQEMDQEKLWVQRN